MAFCFATVVNEKYEIRYVNKKKIQYYSGADENDILGKPQNVIDVQGLRKMFSRNIPMNASTENENTRLSCERSDDS